MLRIRNLSNAMQKRTLRVLHGQTQATPYGGTLHPALRNTDGSFRAPVTADTTPIDYTANTYLLQGGLAAGTVMARSQGEAFLPHPGNNTARPFGLLANFVGGTLDDLQDANEIGVWYGPGSVYEILYPAFDDTGLAAAYAAAGVTAGNPVLLYAQTDSRLGVTNPGGNSTAVAELIERRSAAVIQVKLLV
jgi:hypothetical protein